MADPRPLTSDASQSSASAAVAESDIDVGRELERFRQRLLDLTNRNALVNFKVPTRRSRSAVVLGGLEADEAWSRLVVSERAVRVAADPPEESPTSGEPDADEEAEEDEPRWRVVSSVRVEGRLALPPAEEVRVGVGVGESRDGILVPEGSEAEDEEARHAATEHNLTKRPSKEVAHEHAEKATGNPPAAKVSSPEAPPPSPPPPPHPEPAAPRPKPPADALLASMDDDRLDTVFRTIRSRARSGVEETGVNFLYLALGMLEWYEDEKAQKPLRAPLVLIPVEVERSFDARAGRYAYSLKYTGEEVPANLSLQKRLERDFGLTLPEMTEDLKPSGYFDAVRVAVEPLTRWRVESGAVLGFFSFNRLLMYLDLDPARWPEERPLTQMRLVRQVFEGAQAENIKGEHIGLFARDYDIDEQPEAAEVQLVDNADASQHSALVDVAAGRDLVIEGPPGTGKSQTITNAIADAMHDGRSVLFVAEKLAALEVVRANLERVGLGDLCLELHSDAASPKSVIESLSRRLTQDPPRPPRMEHEREAMEEARDRLNDYADAIEQPVGPRGETLGTVMWHVVELEGRGLRVPRELEDETSADETSLRHARGMLGELAAVCRELGPPREHPWHGFRPVARDDRGVADARAAVERWRDAGEAMRDAEQAAKERLGIDVEHNGIQVLHRLRESDVDRWRPLLAADRVPPPQWLSRIDTAAEHDAARDWTQLHARFTAAAATADAAVFGTRGDALPAARELVAILPQLDPAVASLQRTQLPGLLARLATLRNFVQRLLAAAAHLDAAGVGPVRDIAEYEAAASLYRLLHHPAMADPATLDPRLYERATLQHLIRGRDRSAELQAAETEIAETFILLDAPPPQRLAEVRQTLRRHGGSMLRMLRGNYRAARSDVKAFLQGGVAYEPMKSADALERLEKHVEAREAFAEDEPLNRLFPAMFRGMQTQWQPLEQSVAWVQKTQKHGLDHARATDLLRRRESAADAMRPAEVREAVDAVRREWEGIEPAAVLGEPLSPGTPLSRLAGRVEAVAATLAGLGEASRSFRTDAAESVADLAAPAQAVLEAQELAGPLMGEDHFRSMFDDTLELPSADAVRPLVDAVAWIAAFREAGVPHEILFDADADAERDSAGEAGGLTGRLRAAADEAVALQRAWNRWQADRAAAEAVLAPEPGRLPEGDAAGEVAVAAGLLEKMSGLLPWVRYRQVLDRVGEAGLGGWATAVDAGTLPAADAAETYELAAYDALARAAVAATPVIRDFTRPGHEGVRQRYATLDTRLMELEQARVRALAADVDPPAGNATGRVGNYTEMGLIRHEAAKQTRFCKVRDLMARAPESIALLKPCLMMSPLSVAQFLPRDADPFDLVIMDEASQIKPEDALGAIARAKQLVVVGDPKQLPPTTFFERNFDDIDEPEPEDATAAYGSESILEVQMRTSPAVRRLKGHYRSKHESLIAFSNQHFYDGELVIFPSPTRTSQTGRLGVYHHRVEGGTFHRGRNPVEAEALARAIIRHAVDHPAESLGVGVFNLAQRELIEEVLDALCTADADARKAVERLSHADDRQEPLFIKNLENLQGDERDVIFLGYTYGPDPATGRVMQRFGPITGQDGWRRLNVLITRAKRRVEVFASLSSTDIAGGPDKSRGVNAMRDYLAFAETGRLPEQSPADEHTPTTPFEHTLTRIVESAGLEAVPKVGVAGYFIDMGVRHPDDPDTYLLGIEHDGENYHAARSTRDRDRSREGVMRARGWNLHRIWTADWYQNPTAEERRLRESLESIVGDTSPATNADERTLDRTDAIVARRSRDGN